MVGDRVFVTAYSGYGESRDNIGKMSGLVRHLLCLDFKTGKEVWRKDIPGVQDEDPYEGPGVPTHGYASHSPVSDGEHVFAFFGKSGVYAFDLKGNEIWHQKVGNQSDPMLGLII